MIIYHLEDDKNCSINGKLDNFQTIFGAIIRFFFLKQGSRETELKF